MKNQPPSNLLTRSSLALALALGIWAPLQAQSDQPMKDMPMKDRSMLEGKTAVQGAAAGPAKGMMMDGKMMQRHQAMMVEMKAQDAELTAQVAVMNSAPKDKKLELLAAIVTRMVEQRTAMNARMGAMQGEMMKCMGDSMPMDPKSPMPPPMRKGMEMKP